MGMPEDFLEGFAWSGNISGFAGAAQEAGLSESAALDSFRELGGSVADYRFSQIWEEISLGNIEPLPTDAGNWFTLPDAGDIETFETKSARGFLYQFEAREQIFGTGDFTTRVMSVRSDYLITPNEAFRTLSSYYYSRPAGTGTPQNLLVGADDLSVFSLEPGA